MKTNGQAKFETSENLRRLGRKLAAQSGIPLLKPGERRPAGAYLVDHFTGRSLALRIMKRFGSAALSVARDDSETT
jgi:hypothetical protein